PPDSMFLEGPEASLPSPDAEAAIARSKSRYKGSRPKPPRSQSTPSVPAIVPLEVSVNSAADKGKIRPNTTFVGSADAPPADDDDEPLIKLVQGRSGVQLPRNRNRSPEAPVGGGPSYKEREHQAESAKKPDLPLTKEDHRFHGSRHHHSPEKQRPYNPSSRLVNPDPGGPPRDIRKTEPGRPPATSSARPAVVPKKSFTQRLAGLVSQPHSAAEAKEQLKQMISNPIPLGDAVAPATQYDAPKSAVNTGERLVRVKYKEFQLPICVTPSTTSVDVIRSVSEKIATSLDEALLVVLESFKQLGLERPLRRYEHIRDVLNSWDSDSQNTLIIEPSDFGTYDDELDVKTVTRKQPDNSTFYLYHSQRPGHWDKREVTLRSDGQMLIAKSNGAETTNICHLSDFDVYIPTARQIAKKIRPPRRICFAVKSQQKSNMFMSTINFVHFFSSSDKKVAKSFYTAVQEWRSWYLVNVMGKGAELLRQKAEEHPSQRIRNKSDESRPRQLVQRRQQVSGVDNPEPAIADPFSDTNNIRASSKEPDPVSVTALPIHGKTSLQEPRDRQVPLVSMSKSVAASTPKEGLFADGGLLGRNTTNRNKGLPGHVLQPVDPPIHRPAPSSSPIKAAATELKRTSSQMRKPKPLIDLTPQYQEPPQHTRKGRGVTPGQIPAGGLVDIATSPEVAIPIPPTTSWRRPGTSSGPEASPARNRSQS
ncbi:MAG: hypothetical protein Q9219_006129, partial [cf. Caloplaca sp. 3 TL-2023]